MSVPYRFEVTHTTAEIRAAHDGLGAGEESGVHVTVAGRVMLHRAQGKLAFATLRDIASHIYTMRADGSEQQPIPNQGPNNDHPVWRPRAE